MCEDGCGPMITDIAADEIPLQDGLICLFILNCLLFYEEGNTFNPYIQCALVRNTDYQHILSVPLRYSMGNSRRLRLDRTSSRFKMNVTF